MKEMSHFDHAMRDWWTSSAIHRRKTLEKSRRSKKHELCDPRHVAFKTFGKCDSVKEFPISFASCLNSGDLQSFSKLIHSRTSKNCKINMIGKHLDTEKFLRVFDFIEELYPDCITCIHTISSVGNEITAVFYLQYTANKVIDSSMRKIYDEKEKALLEICPVLHTDPHRLKTYIDAFPVEDRPSALAKVYSAEELVVSGQGVMHLSINEKTGKIKRLEVDVASESTEFEIVDVKNIAF